MPRSVAGLVEGSTLRLMVALAMGSSLVPQTSTAEPPTSVELYKKSQDSYQAGNFSEAAEYLEQAYLGDPNPILLYNLARARESAGDLDLAAEAYNSYLEQAPDAADAASVRARLVVIRMQLVELRQLRASLAARSPVDRSADLVTDQPVPKVTRQPWPMITTFAGAGAVAAGIALGLIAEGRHAEARTSPSELRREALASEARTLSDVASASAAAGGTLVAAGLIWWLTDR